MQLPNREELERFYRLSVCMPIHSSSQIGYIIFEGRFKANDFS